MLTGERAFTAFRKASFVSAVHATANLSVRLSVCLSVRPSVTLRYCVKTNEGTQRDAVFTFG